jgi:pimeloyl-ACP methyl ester carboxylesterase
MPEFRKYGAPPFTVVMAHGGPGAGGEMAPVARELSSRCGVLEPLQTALSVDGQIAELKNVIEANAAPPVMLCGFSWGAWLCFLLAARHPELVKKLILISSGAFTGEYLKSMQETRLSRLTETSAKNSGNRMLEDPAVEDKQSVSNVSARFSRTDAYDPLPDDAEIDFRPDIYAAVWPEAAELRSTGRLLEAGRQIKCPVTAIHGDYDPHPADGVRVPLPSVVRNFNFIELKNCGHKPWAERQARNEFSRILKHELC